MHILYIYYILLLCMALYILLYICISQKGLQRSLARVQGCLVHDVAENKIEVAKVEISHKKLAIKLRSMELENRRFVACGNLLYSNNLLFGVMRKYDFFIL